MFSKGSPGSLTITSGITNDTANKTDKEMSPCHPVAPLNNSSMLSLKKQARKSCRCSHLAIALKVNNSINNNKRKQDLYKVAHSKFYILG